MEVQGTMTDNIIYIVKSLIDGLKHFMKNTEDDVKAFSFEITEGGKVGKQRLDLYKKILPRISRGKLAKEGKEYVYYI